MSIAPSLPSAEQLRELTGTDFSADIFELPAQEASPSTPERSPVRRRLVVVTLVILVAVAAGIAYETRDRMTPQEAPVSGTADVPASEPAATDAVWTLVEPEFDALEKTPARVMGEVAPMSVASPSAPVTPSTADAAESPAAAAGAASVEESPVVSLADTVAVTEAEASVTPRPASVVALDVADLEKRTLNNVQQLLFRGNRRSAKSALVDFMQEYGERPEPRTLLAGLLLQEGNLTRASALLSDVDEITPSPRLRVLRARVLAAERRPADAIALLEAFPPAIDVMADYHALLALLYQQTSRFDDAAEVYASLIAYDPMHANWLLGYAISLEGAGRLATARETYTDLLSRGSLDRELSEFAYARLRNLSY